VFHLPEDTLRLRPEIKGGEMAIIGMVNLAERVLRGKKLRAWDQTRAIAAQRVADGDTAPNPVHREFGGTS
jgi:hypothetical protein